MKIGIPKEIKNNEYRVGLTPSSVSEFVSNGHKVAVQSGAGEEIGYSDDIYKESGAVIVSTAEKIFEESELIIKVKEPQPNECKMLSEGQVLFTYLHLAPDPVQTELLLESKCTAIAYETVKDGRGSLPLLAPMSEIAGKLSIQIGSNILLKSNGGNGLLIGGVAGTVKAKVCVIGGGMVGSSAAKIAKGLGAHVVIIDKSVERLRQLDEIFDGNIETLYGNEQNIHESIADADIVVGAVLVPGATAPKLLTRSMLSLMKPKSVLIDVSIDQGGCFETSKATTHQNPTYEVDNIIHYCVANMPGAAPLTSTQALNNATLHYGLKLANEGFQKALSSDRGFANGLNIHAGRLYEENVAKAQNIEYTSLESIIS